MPVLAAVRSRVGECQERVMRVGTMIGAKFGKVWQAGKRSREQQRLGRDAERAVCMPVRLVERGPRVNSDLRPT